MLKEMKLFKVTIQANNNRKVSYVVAEDSAQAYQKVRKYMDDKNLCFRNEREMQSIDLIADTQEYPECGISLFL